MDKNQSSSHRDSTFFGTGTDLNALHQSQGELVISPAVMAEAKQFYLSMNTPVMYGILCYLCSEWQWPELETLDFFKEWPKMTASQLPAKVHPDQMLEALAKEPRIAIPLRRCIETRRTLCSSGKHVQKKYEDFFKTRDRSFCPYKYFDNSPMDGFYLGNILEDVDLFLKYGVQFFI